VRFRQRNPSHEYQQGLFLLSAEDSEDVTGKMYYIDEDPQHIFITITSNDRPGNIKQRFNLDPP